MRQMLPQQLSKWKIQKVLLHQNGSLAGNVKMVMSIYDMSDSCVKISKMSYIRREPPFSCKSRKTDTWMFLLWRTQKHLSFARPAVLSTSAQLLIRQSRDDRSTVSRFMCQAREALLMRYQIYETSRLSFFRHTTSVPFLQNLEGLSRYFCVESSKKLKSKRLLIDYPTPVQLSKNRGDEFS
jgi:hypothetical protein